MSQRIRFSLSTAAAAALFLCTVFTSSADILPGPVPAPPKPRIEVAFVLDTTGSMAGLIDGAKRKIWQIANQLADGKPAPDIQMALIAYRDRGDYYVTR